MTIPFWGWVLIYLTGATFTVILYAVFTRLGAFKPDKSLIVAVILWPIALFCTLFVGGLMALFQVISGEIRERE